MRDYKIRHIGWEIIDGVPLSGTAMVALMAPSLSPVEERLTNKYTTQNIGCRITTIEKIS